MIRGSRLPLPVLDLNDAEAIASAIEEGSNMNDRDNDQTLEAALESLIREITPLTETETVTLDKAMDVFCVRISTPPLLCRCRIPPRLMVMRFIMMILPICPCLCAVISKPDIRLKGRHPRGGVSYLHRRTDAGWP